MVAIVDPLLCLQSAPPLFRILMHSLHSLTIPLYGLSFYSLIMKTPKTLKIYKNYLLWHTFGNFAFEFYVSTLMLPMLYVPYPVFRCTGLLMYLNVSGLLQLYFLMYLTVQIGLSILEMFRYRFNAAMNEETKTTIAVRIFFYMFYFLALALPVLEIGALPRSVRHQEFYKEKLFEKFPNASREILCHNTVISPPIDEIVLFTTVVLIVLLCAVSSLIVLTTTTGIVRKLGEMKKSMSTRTLQMQKMLFVSIAVQGSIHLIMLLIPVFIFIFSIFSTLDNNLNGYFAILTISFHGSLSTIAMIIFTKPVQDGVLYALRFIYKPKHARLRLQSVASLSPKLTMTKIDNS
ncbi:unnamed protein product [Caenorhabditis bovis]|uniref:Serpentine Receptor, class H n=1 Tax=Caenorhabditis bovis TaxID=2654633 RepID=A0A8S1E9B7_9PELO|nr:unnamed protein product [Caenorhabditis bovis]